jgi:hypothetical protein
VSLGQVRLARACQFAKTFPVEFQLRKATAADWDFIWELRVRTMKRVISESHGWDVDMQRTYAAESLNGQIVLVGGQPRHEVVAHRAMHGWRESRLTLPATR